MRAQYHRKEALTDLAGSVGLGALAPAAPTAVRRRILLYGLNFAPEPTGIGKFTGEMAEWLARQGHDVRVITTAPYYPDWRVSSGYRAWAYRRETWKGVEVFRTPIWVPRVPSGAKRLVHLASFAASSLPVLLANLFWRPDLIWCVAPTMVCAPAGALAARLCGAASWLHIQDLEVDAAFDLGMLRGARLRRGALFLERALVRAFDRVSSISHNMVAKLREKGAADQRSVLFPNWADTDVIRPVSGPNAYREQLGIPPEAFVVMYSGTMGAKQGLEVLAGAARRLQAETNMHFLLCGQGAGRESLEAACIGLERVHWLPLQPVERLASLLGAADVHVLPQQRAAADLMLPSKLTGMLASGRPVLATAEPGTEIARWVEGCGAIVPPEDEVAMAAALGELARTPEFCRHLGVAARRRAVEQLSRGSVLQRFEDAMEEILGAH